MILRLAVTAAVLIVPSAAIAETSDICQALQRRLATLPRVIGSTAEVRRHAEALRFHNDEIRFLRTEMRRARCGAGSIVTFGQRDDVCGEIAADLRDMEARRDAIAAQRSAARQIIRPSGERNAITAALEANQCSSAGETTVLPAAIGPEQTPSGGEQPYSAITTLTPRTEPAHSPAVETPPPPARPYDPSRKVRTVGPVFLPDDTSIDLTNPTGGGAQPRQ